eukprot:NODE_294_length_10530_cov_0.245326.p8 type:complete len:113 gc:universal NODE_294_length_10530_cov_0.245326:380-42(-)
MPKSIVYVKMDVIFVFKNCVSGDSCTRESTSHTSEQITFLKSAHKINWRIILILVITGIESMGIGQRNSILNLSNVTKSLKMYLGGKMVSKMTPICNVDKMIYWGSMALYSP